MRTDSLEGRAYSISIAFRSPSAYWAMRTRRPRSGPVLRSGGAEERRSGGAEERRSGGAEERRSGGAEERRPRSGAALAQGASSLKGRSPRSRGAVLAQGAPSSLLLDCRGASYASERSSLLSDSAECAHLRDCHFKRPSMESGIRDQLK
jgi:hypothetical protein